jgi:alpha-ketoglutarate-dependent taurine dioxygenase
MSQTATVRRTTGRLSDGRQIIYYDDSPPYVDGTATRSVHDTRPAVPAEQALLYRWHAIVARAAAAAPRFLLEPGDLLWTDNNRMFHGRDAYTGRERLLRRMWYWTDRAIAAPDPAVLGEQRCADLTFVT